MIERFSFLAQDFKTDAPKELQLLSFIAQSFFQPFSLEDNLLVILSALTSGSGVGFNRAMMFLVEDHVLKGQHWLGPRSVEDANAIWQTLATPGIGYAEIIEHNRGLLARHEDNLTSFIKPLVYDLEANREEIPSLSTRTKEIVHVRDARNEPLVSPEFLSTVRVEEFLCIPLFSETESFGEIILDNAITGARIEARDIKLASLCGLLAGKTIHTARLHTKLAEMDKMAALGEMSAYVTHQLRNPLTAIGGFVDQLSDPAVPASKKKRNLRIIRTEVKRLEEALFRIGRVLKVEVHAPARCDARGLLNVLLASPEVRLKSRGKHLEVAYETESLLFLCDPVYAGEAVRNVLDNAFEATSMGGSVRLRCYRESPSWVVVSVADSGPGIPETERAMLFRPFFSTKKSGLGLGLLFVKRIMDACGGKVEVRSEEGTGTMFRLYFPAAGKGAGE